MLLKITNLSVEYFRKNKTLPALRSVDFELLKSETHAVVGESGCGKSTLAFSILKLIFPEEGTIKSGSILYDKKDILTLSDRELLKIRGKKISIIFQDPFSSLNPVIKIGNQVLEMIDESKTKLSLAQKKELVYNTFKNVMLNDSIRIYNSYPHEISGGQRQRVQIAMSLINKPDIIIADEPTTSLDVTIQKEILDLIEKLKNEYSLSMIFITHNLPVAIQRSDRISVMYAGKIVETASRDDVYKNPKHPYTKGLIDSVPRLKPKSVPKNSLKGQVPDMSNLPNGCPFHPRCEMAMDICKVSEPEDYMSDNSTVKCFLYKDKQ